MKNLVNKNKRIKDRTFMTLLIVIFITGLAVMLYPVVSDYINSKNQSRSVAEYDQLVNMLDGDKYTELFDDAEKYNRELSENGISFGHDEDHEKYNSILNINNTGVMGYVTIPGIKTELPLYHGTDDTVLNIAAGHLEGTSFPVGGESTHAVISAHRGLPTSKLFTDLDKIEIGDVFSVTVLNEVLTYEVDDIRIVEPYRIESLRIEKGNDYITLMTCTPYGINTHRLLVRGHRTVSDSGKPTGKFRVLSEAVRIDPHEVAIVVSVPIILIFFIIFMTNGLIKERKKSYDTLKRKIEAGEQNEKK